MSIDLQSKGSAFKRQFMADMQEMVIRLLNGVSATTAAQKDGVGISDQHRVFNFQGPGVTVSDDSAMRRTNVVIPGAPVATSTQTFVSAAGNERVFALGTIPANWQTTGFTDSGWALSVLESGDNSSFFTVVPTSSWIAPSTLNGDRGLGDVEFLARRTFALPAGTITSATLEINIDDDNREGGPFINGNALTIPTRPTSPLPVSYVSVAIPISWLVAGSNNVLAVAIHSGGGLVCVCYRITVTYAAAGTDTQYELVAHKNAVSGYAGLDSGGLVSPAELGTGTADATHFLRGDGTWATVSTGSISVREIDTVPTVTATVLELPNGTVTDQGGGVARYTPITPGATPYANVQDQKAQNTDGGTFTSGAWRTRTLNTIVNDANSIISLASNQITLAAGTYRVIASAPANGVSNHQIRLQNITDSTTLRTGTSEISGSGDGTQTRSWLTGEFTLTGTKAIELQHQCATTITSVGFGSRGNFTTEVYAIVELWKIA